MSGSRLIDGFRVALCRSALLTLVAFSTASAQDKPDNPAEMMQAFQSRFRQFRNDMQAPLNQQRKFGMPPLFAEVSPEELRRLEAVKISPAEEAEFGNQVLEQFEKQLRANRVTLQWRSADVTYIRKLAELIRPQMKQADDYKKLRIGIIPSKEADAFSIPGGILLFSSGLLETAGSEAALIGVIAHELSHLDRGHQLYELRRSKALNKRQSLVDFSQMWASFLRPFHPEFESQADQDALNWMMNAGYDGRELGKLIDRWNTKQDAQAPWLDFMPNFSRTHPDGGLRAKRIFELFDAHPKRNAPLTIGIQNLKQRTPATAKLIPN